MKSILLFLGLVVMIAAAHSFGVAARDCVLAAGPRAELGRLRSPRVDHHAHIASKAAAALIDKKEALTAEELIQDMDAAGIQQSVVLSVAYWFGEPDYHFSDEYDRVQAENDWVAEQVSRHADRQVAFCSLNPLREYALAEVRRCASSKRFRGLKLHFTNSMVNLENPEHVSKVREVFRLANQSHLSVIIHVWIPGKAYGPEHSNIFLRDILPVAKDIPVQIAHLAGTGPGYNLQVDSAMAVFAQAIERGDPTTSNLYFDVATDVTPNLSNEMLALIAQRLRQVGMKRVLFGSDHGPGVNPPPAEAWKNFQRLPLTDAEFVTVGTNVAPYLH